MVLPIEDYALIGDCRTTAWSAGALLPRRVAEMLCGWAVSFHPDLRAHVGPIDEPLAPITQVGHQLIDGFDLVDFLAGGAMIPIGLWPLAQIQHAMLLRSQRSRQLGQPLSPVPTATLARRSTEFGGNLRVGAKDTDNRREVLPLAGSRCAGTQFCKRKSDKRQALACEPE
jgi:hypothetical protein